MNHYLRPQLRTAIAVAAQTAWAVANILRFGGGGAGCVGRRRKTAAECHAQRARSDPTGARRACERAHGAYMGGWETSF